MSASAWDELDQRVIVRKWRTRLRVLEWNVDTLNTNWASSLECCCCLHQYSLPAVSAKFCQFWSELQSYLSFVDQSTLKFVCLGVSIVCNAVFRLMMFCCTPEIFTIQSWSCANSRQNFDVFGPPNFRQKGRTNFWPNFTNMGHQRTRSKVWWWPAKNGAVHTLLLTLHSARFFLLPPNAPLCSSDFLAHSVPFSAPLTAPLQCSDA